MRLDWAVIPLVLIGIIVIQSVDASCAPDRDWPLSPCFDYGVPNQSEVVEAWKEYYDYKGTAFMEWKKIEMFQTIENENFQEWINDKQENNNVYRYYLSIDEIQNQFPVNDGDYLAKLRLDLVNQQKISSSISESSPSEFLDISNNTKQSQEKIVITMVPNASYPPTCAPSIPPYDKPNCFLPAIVNVEVGQSVIFENSKPSVTMIASGNPQHGPDGRFQSPSIPSGSSYEVSFDNEGIYTYFDFVSPWMAGTIIVGNSTNLPSITNAGQDRIIVEGKFVHLSMDGDDPENGKLRYSWQQVSGPTVKLSSGNFPTGAVSNDFPYLPVASKTTSFTAPNVYATTSFVFEATIIDDALQRSKDTVKITVVDDFGSNDFTKRNNIPNLFIKDPTVLVSTISKESGYYYNYEDLKNKYLQMSQLLKTNVDAFDYDKIKVNFFDDSIILEKNYVRYWGDNSFNWVGDVVDEESRHMVLSVTDEDIRSGHYRIGTHYYHIQYVGNDYSLIIELDNSKRPKMGDDTPSPLN